MSELIVEKTGRLSGEVKAPPSKSYTHRAVIASSLVDGISNIANPLSSDDTLATVNACRKFGAGITLRKQKWVIRGLPKLKTPYGVVDCKNSASTMRFMIPLAALVPGITTFTGGGSLRKRPMGPLLDALTQLGVKSKSTRGYPPVVIHGGGIRGGDASMPGDVSSQFISGLLFACPLAKKETTLTLTTPLESKPYIHMTLEVLKKHNVKISVSKDMQHYSISPNQLYQPANHTVSGDYSAAAFLLAAAAITGSKVAIEGLLPHSTQGDEAIVEILQSMGIKVKRGGNYVQVFGGLLEGIDIDAQDIPDLVPVCAVLACYAEGKTRIFNAERLRLKESDRLSAITMELRKMGAKIIKQRDELIIRGPSLLHGAKLNPHNDHRIAMACTVAALNAQGVTRIKNPACINKSYPRFIQDLKTLGAALSVR